MRRITTYEREKMLIILGYPENLLETAEAIKCPLVVRFGVFSILPNRSVRDQWEYLTKMERHFPIKPGQPIGMALASLYSSFEFPD